LYILLTKIVQEFETINQDLGNAPAWTDTEISNWYV